MNDSLSHIELAANEVFKKKNSVLMLEHKIELGKGRKCKKKSSKSPPIEVREGLSGFRKLFLELMSSAVNLEIWKVGGRVSQAANDDEEMVAIGSSG